MDDLTQQIQAESKTDLPARLKIGHNVSFYIILFIYTECQTLKSQKSSLVNVDHWSVVDDKDYRPHNKGLTVYRSAQTPAYSSLNTFLIESNSTC